MEADDPLLGTSLGNYRVTRELGHGGMGRVYLGVHDTLGSRVAIKVLLGDSAAQVDRFFDEARAASLVAHEHIANVIDVGTAPGGRPYIVMEFVDGAPLRKAMVGASLVAIARVMAEVLAALQAAHGAGIVHRDLKPDNILVTPGGHAKVLDFGVAKLAPTLRGPHSPRTATGAAIGTPAYMAPEQIRGRAVDARTDLYAVGVVLFELVTGERPFDADSDFEVMHAHLEQAAPSARARRPELPAALDQVITRALAKEPDARYASAADMARALMASVVVAVNEKRAAPSTRDIDATARERPSNRPTVVRRRTIWLAVAVIPAGAIAATLAISASSPTQQPANTSAQTVPAVAPSSRSTTADATQAPPDCDATHYANVSSMPDACPMRAQWDRAKTQSVVHNGADYNVRHFDAAAWLASARTRVRELAPDAELVEVVIEPVAEDGLATLVGGHATNDQSGHGLFRFQVPHPKDDAPCEIDMSATEFHYEARWVQPPCNPARPIADPACSSAAAFTRIHFALQPDSVMVGRWDGVAWQFRRVPDHGTSTPWQRAACP